MGNGASSLDVTDEGDDSSSIAICKQPKFKIFRQCVIFELQYIWRLKMTRNIYKSNIQNFTQ